MGDGLRTIRVLTNDDALLASVRAAAADLAGTDYAGWEVAQVSDQQALVDQPPVIGDLLMIDAWGRGDNVYEYCRRLTGRTKCRTFVVVEQGNDLAESIARFCGATGVMQRPVTRTSLSGVLAKHPGPAAPLPSEGRGDGELELPEALLVDLTSGQRDDDLVFALIDPGTGLFNYAFLNYKLDEEFKRARRFDHPLACVMLGFEGQATDEVLRELAGIFLASSRDTDVLGRFDESSFLFLLANTGPDGAEVMAQRVAEMAEERGLKDLVGDPLVISVGISHFPGPDLDHKEALYGAAREAFFAAREDGGGVVVG
jgi:diguanylate cyclase (GGDEF)-like protein